MGLSFAATSPYVYVFRSEKVQKFLKQMVVSNVSRQIDGSPIFNFLWNLQIDTFCCCRSEIDTPGLASKLASR